MVDITPVPPVVVRIRMSGGVIVNDCDVYIGRAQTQGGWHLSASPWMNRHAVKPGATVDSVCRKYEADIRADAKMMAQIPTLFGKRLGCWCIDRPTAGASAKCRTCAKALPKCQHFQCHGDVLVKIAKEQIAAAASIEDRTGIKLSVGVSPAAVDGSATISDEEWEILMRELGL